MRRFVRSSGIAAAGFVLALGVAAATDRAEQAPESRAYLSFSFGGEKAAPRDFHYGLRIDHDSRFVEGTAPPLMQFDFTRRGLNDAQLNGLSVLSQRYRLRQSEEQAAAEGAGEAAGEEGFFEGMWSGTKNFFGGLFGGGEEEEVAEAAPDEAAPAEEAPAEAAPEELADGAFANYSIADWGLLALGVAGLGLAASEVSGGDEDPLRPTGGTSTTGSPGCNTQFITSTCVTTNTYAPSRWTTPYDRAGNSPEYQQWLDGGTGQMGDLGGR
jgi:hypothetical protein